MSRRRLKIIAATVLGSFLALVALIYSWTFMPDGGRLSLKFALLSKIVAWQVDDEAAPKLTVAFREKIDDVIVHVQAVETPPARIEVKELLILGADGNTLELRLYRPKSDAAKTSELKPVILFLHGGGFVAGGIRTHDNLCRYLADFADAVVFSVEYRLAPEHPFPAALRDAYASLEWAQANAARFGGDEGKLAVAGDSAGGNLAAVLAIKARDEQGPRVSAQVLLYPLLDLATFDRDSYTQFAAKGYGIQPGHIDHVRKMYAPNLDPKNAYLSPLHAADLSRLPPALVVVGQYDSLRDEGIAYAERLKAAGVAATAHVFPGMVHGFVSMHRQRPEAEAALLEIAKGLKQTWGAH